jgi:hypothetical protein
MVFPSTVWWAWYPAGTVIRVGADTIDAKGGGQFPSGHRGSTTGFVVAVRGASIRDTTPFDRTYVGSFERATDPTNTIQISVKRYFTVSLLPGGIGSVLS